MWFVASEIYVKWILLTTGIVLPRLEALCDRTMALLFSTEACVFTNTT
jgi:hypothetical protein